jgi:hypothetical protein
MKQIILLVSGFLLLVGGIISYLASNLGNSTATIEFSKSEKPGLNTMKITGPYGWKCITYEKSKISADAKELTMSGKGMRDFPLFGATEENTNYYPAEGKIEAIPLNQEYLFYQPNNNFECYVLITKDSRRFDLLK